MRKAALALAVALLPALSACAERPAVDFDQGVDSSAALEDVREPAALPGASGKAGEGAPAGLRRKIFILKSSGVCDGCAEAVSKMLFTAGLESQILGPDRLKAAVRPRDVLVIGGGIPGAEGEWTIKQDLVKAGAFDWLKEHIARGGRYVGICAGAYLTEEWIDKDDGERGLDLFPGRIDNYVKDEEVRYLSTRDGTVAAAVFPYGKGLVGVLSPHLEADEEWARQAGKKDPDGLDYDLGIAFFRRVVEQP